MFVFQGRDCVSLFVQISVFIYLFLLFLGVECCLRQMDRTGKLLPPGTFLKQSLANVIRSEGLHAKPVSVCSSA